MISSHRNISLIRINIWNAKCLVFSRANYFWVSSLYFLGRAILLSYLVDSICKRVLARAFWCTWCILLLLISYVYLTILYSSFLITRSRSNATDYPFNWQPFFFFFCWGPIIKLCKLLTGQLSRSSAAKIH